MERNDCSRRDAIDAPLEERLDPIISANRAREIEEIVLLSLFPTAA